ncbi:amidohydrolase [Solirubrobacter phytolaccae]|uniref:Amidohydrolase n=1 Tax=Solirubrobacter phytolaccae TaxID=1404360 RepID=A0A9X3ND39_9ACTN|nr:amidohydrolase [Solirubrobacter phytolaccae]MDA0184198.1 amidohydrolase [Solirubrobacter phytolaccae]
MAGVEEDVVAWRRHLHRHPEVSFEEHETSAFVAQTLAELGVEVSRPTETSVLGRLRGDGDGPVVALRADIDALPIQEESGVDFASERPGAMHACGHDGHTAMLLGAAKTLAADGVPRGEVRFIFQHGEELAPGGARDMIAAGVMEGVDFVYGCHLWTPLEYGKVAAVPGDWMAAADFFEITITGRGGHAGLPHTAVDTVACAAELVGSLQHIVARRIDPLQPAVVTIGSIHAGDAPNVIPGEARLTGTARSFDPDVRSLIPKLIEEIGHGVSAAHGASFELRFVYGYKPVVNDPVATELVRSVVRDELVEPDPIMGGDDFSAYLAEAPGCYAFVGAGGPFPHHHPRFVIDERALAIGTRLHVDVANKVLG